MSDVNALKAGLIADIDAAVTLDAVEALRVGALGKSGVVTGLLKTLGPMSPEERLEKGPPIQDLWMLLSGSRAEMSEQLTHLLEGYSHFATFDARELVLVESLRTLRMIHYSAWLARRWGDPAFPAAFPWFVEPRYWENQILALREQLAAIAEGPLEL